MSDLNHIETSKYGENGSDTSSDSEILAPRSYHNSGSKENLQQLKHSNSSEDSISGRCSICWEALGEIAIAFPCGHRFDLACIRRWTSEGNNQSTTNTCPVCRNPILELRHSFDDEGNFQSEVVDMEGNGRRATSEERAAEDAERTERGRRFQEAFAQREAIARARREQTHGRQYPGDEDIAPGMPARHIHIANERRRLRNLPDLAPIVFGAVTLNLDVDEEHQLPGVKRETIFQIGQAGLVTTTVLIKVIMISTERRLCDVEVGLPDYFEDEAANSHLEEVRKAVDEIREALAHFSFGLNFTAASTQMTSPLSAYSRNLACCINTVVDHIVYYPSGDDEGRSHIVVSWQKTLREEGPALADGDIENVRKSRVYLGRLKANSTQGTRNNTSRQASR